MVAVFVLGELMVMALCWEEAVSDEASGGDVVTGGSRDLEGSLEIGMDGKMVL